MIDLHRKAMKLAQEGFLIIDKNPERAISYFKEALALEGEVATSYSGQNGKEPARSVLFRSAASLAKLSNDYSQLNYLAKAGLAGNPPKEVFDELLSLLMNKDQSQFCFSENDFIRLLAPAGSGKTTSLLWRCLNLINASEKTANFLVFTFTRVARDELRDRINSNPEFNLLKGKVRIETLNQWGYNYIRNIKDGLQLKSTKQDFYFLVNNNLRPIWDRKPYLAKLTNKTFKYKLVVNIFSELKTLGFNHDFPTNDNFLENFKTHLAWLKESGLEDYFIEKVFNGVEELELLNYNKDDHLGQLEPFLLFWKKSSEELWSQSIITLEDQKYWALRMLESQYSPGKLFPASSRYHHIMVDEFQDINPLDLALINKLVDANNSSLSIIGDDDQAIYEWRGSSPRFIVNPDQFLSRKFETYILDINYRSPKNIVEYSQNLINLNENRVKKNTIPFSSQEAEIHIKKYDNHVKSLSYILKFVENVLKEGKENVGIISRKKGQLIPLQILLTSKEIPYYAKEDLNILLSQAFNELKRILVISVEKDQRKNSDSIVDEIILCCNLIKKYPLSRNESRPLIAYLRNSNFKTLREGVLALTKYPNTIKSASGASFASAILKVIDSSTVSETILNTGEYFEGLQKHYVKSEDDIFYKEPPFLYLTDYAERYGNDFWKFIDHIEAAISKMETMYDENQDSTDTELKNKIHLMTALRAKGKEFDHVIILDVNDGLWPIKYAETEDQLEQERRLFYVAVTRTKKSLTLLTVKEIHNQKVTISPYVKEMGLKSII